MADRRDLINAQNKLIESYNETKKSMEKAGATPDQLAKLNAMFQKRNDDLKLELGDTLQKLNLGEKIPVQGGTYLGPDINQAKLPDVSKQVGLGKQNMLSKASDVGGDVLQRAKKKGLGKLMGAVPFLGGAAYAFMSGDASAAIPGFGDTESAGPAKGSMDEQIQSGKMAGPEIQAQMEKARQEMLQQSPNQPDQFDENDPRKFSLDKLKVLLQKNR